MTIKATIPDINVQIIKNLPTIKGIHNILYVDGMPLSFIEEFISTLTGEDWTFGEYAPDFNGWEQDWSCDIEVNGNKYQMWGSGYYGNLNIELK